MRPHSRTRLRAASHARPRQSSAQQQRIPSARPRPAARGHARSSRAPRRSVAPVLVVLLGVLVVGAAIWGVASLVGSVLGGGQGTGTGEQVPIVSDQQQAGPGDIVIGVNGDEDTYVLKGEEYLEAGAHAAEPVDGVLTASIETSGSVDTSVPGDYEVTYRVSDSSGHVAEAVRTVHVVDEMETMDGGVPILMYHYVYTEDDQPDTLNANYLLDTKLGEQLAYLVENDFYFPSYPELRAFLEGEHSLPAKSVVLTFDDAQKGFLKYGIPLLEKYRVPATSFVIASQESAPDKVIDYRSPYVSFQSHSYDMHKAGGSIGHGGVISALTKDQILEDLRLAQEVVGSTEAFAYPYGDVTEDGQQAVEEAGILCAFTTVNSWAHVGDDVTALPRVRITGEYELEGFKYLVSA